jgi:hypothetical protein
MVNSSFGCLALDEHSGLNTTLWEEFWLYGRETFLLSAMKVLEKREITFCVPGSIEERICTQAQRPDCLVGTWLCCPFAM